MTPIGLPFFSVTSRPSDPRVVKLLPPDWEFIYICVKASRGSLKITLVFMALACLNMLDFYVCLPCTIAKETTILSHI